MGILKKIVLIALVVLCVVVWVEINNKLKIQAATEPYNDYESTYGVRIDGWREFQGMTTYGRNNDYGCGFTAMAILLQYYNDYTSLSGEILPSNLNYKMDNGVFGNNTRANNLRQYLKDCTPRLIGNLGQEIIQYFNINGLDNATIPVNHKDGLNNFFQANGLNISASYYDSPLLPGYDILFAMQQIAQNRPVIMTILNYKYGSIPTETGTLINGDAHVIVVYGYRQGDNGVQFLAHSGWDTDTELWFSSYDTLPFIYGMTFIDAPVIPRYNTSITENNDIQIDSVNGVLSGQITIPSILNGSVLTKLSNSAFKEQAGITEISIPDTVTNIDSNAFENCTSLEKVVIQREIGDITSLGSDAFLGCSSLETIEVPTKRILDYLYGTNWSYYSNYMHYIEPITDGLTIVSVGGKSQYYLFHIEETNDYNFYHNCDNPIKVTIYDDENSVLLTNTTWDGDPIFIEFEEGGLYKLVIESTESEFFQLNIDEVDESELELGIKYYETLDSYSYAYYKLTTDQSTNTSYTIHSDVVGARTNVYLYDSSYNLVTSSFGDTTHQGAKINYYLTPNTTYIVLVFLISYDYYDDYTIQYYKTNDEVYYLDWRRISKQYFDPLTYDYASFTILSSCYDLVFDEVTKTITFGMIECFWDVTFDEYPNCPEEYVIGMMIGITYDSFENTLAFFSMNGFYQYQAALPYTYSYSATVTDVSITFSSTEWANFVTQGPRV